MQDNIPKPQQHKNSENVARRRPRSSPSRRVCLLAIRENTTAQDSETSQSTEKTGQRTSSYGWSFAHAGMTTIMTGSMPAIAPNRAAQMLRRDRGGIVGAGRPSSIPHLGHQSAPMPTWSYKQLGHTPAIALIKVDSSSGSNSVPHSGHRLSPKPYKGYLHFMHHIVGVVSSDSRSDMARIPPTCVPSAEAKRGPVVHSPSRTRYESIREAPTPRSQLLPRSFSAPAAIRR